MVLEWGGECYAHVVKEAGNAEGKDSSWWESLNRSVLVQMFGHHLLQG